MIFKTTFIIGNSYSNHQISKEFKCAPQGGMRRSRQTNSLVLVSNHTSGPYNDRWENNILHYTGMGLIGDQNFNSQDKILANIESMDIQVHLFESFISKEYTYAGQMTLAHEPFFEYQYDKMNKQRRVIIFPLKRISNQPDYLLAEPILLARESEAAKYLKKISLSELKKLANKSRTLKPNKRSIQATSYERNLYVIAYTKARANGFCELCDSPAPFLNSEKEPYLETHHIIWLSQEGEDTIENTVALCPNCHRKMHNNPEAKDLQILSQLPK